MLGSSRSSCAAASTISRGVSIVGDVEEEHRARKKAREGSMRIFWRLR